MIAKLLHIANSDPPSNKHWRERFYAMKNRIVHRWAKPDGFDLQVFEGKKCWSCTDGMWDEYNECHRCDGSSWYRWPRVIRLNRWRLGRYTFHEPILTAYREAKPDENITFRGRVEHAKYDYRWVLLATFLLAIFYDWSLSRFAFGKWLSGTCLAYKIRRLHSTLTRRCQRCGRRTWSSRKWFCGKGDCIERTLSRRADELESELRACPTDDEEMPF
jgi:hypothetical protein